MFAEHRAEHSWFIFILFQSAAKPKPQPRSKLPDLPNVPSNLPDVPEDNDNANKADDSEIDFDDLSRRFEELKKRH